MARALGVNIVVLPTLVNGFKTPTAKMNLVGNCKIIPSQAAPDDMKEPFTVYITYTGNHVNEADPNNIHLELHHFANLSKNFFSLKRLSFPVWTTFNPPVIHEEQTIDAACFKAHLDTFVGQIASAWKHPPLLNENMSLTAWGKTLLDEYDSDLRETSMANLRATSQLSVPKEPRMSLQAAVALGKISTGSGQSRQEFLQSIKHAIGVEVQGDLKDEKKKRLAQELTDLLIQELGIKEKYGKLISFPFL